MSGWLYATIVANPGAQIEQANVLSGAFGAVPADGAVFGIMFAEDAQGRAFSYAGFRMRQSDYDAIIAAHAAAEQQPEPLRSALLSLDIHSIDAPRVALPDRIAAIVGPNIKDPFTVHLPALGLTVNGGA